MSTTKPMTKIFAVLLTKAEAEVVIAELREAAAGWIVSDEHEIAATCDTVADRLQAAVETGARDVV